MFRNLHRFNCLLTLMLLELRGEASVSAWARILRDNHRAHEGKPPPRPLHDGELLIRSESVRPHRRVARDSPRAGRLPAEVLAHLQRRRRTVHRVEVQA